MILTTDFAASTTAVGTESCVKRVWIAIERLSENAVALIASTARTHCTACPSDYVLRQRRAYLSNCLSTDYQHGRFLDTTGT